MQDPQPGPQRPLPRRAHTKSKTGCRTCKIRKVKCDERRPLCINCERHFKNLIACDFEEQTPVLDLRAPEHAQRSHSHLSARPTYESIPSTAAASTVQSRKVGRDAETLRLTRAVGEGRIDPFEMRPETEEPSPNVDMLIGHYLANFGYRSFPLYANKVLIEQWWPFIREDDLLFNVMLLLTSVDRQRLQSRPNPIHTQRLLDQCLSLLNQRIQDSLKALSDHTLTSVAALSAMEHDRGNVRGLNLHMEGLKSIVQMRGGLDAIRRTNAMAANFVFWCAMVTVDEPSLSPLTYGDELADDGWLHDLDTATLVTHDGSQARLVDFNVDVVTANVLHKVQQLSKSYTAKLEYNSPEEATGVLSNLCSILERMLRLSKTPSEDSPIPGLSQSCRLAGCLHLFTPQAGYFPDPTLMLHTLVRDLKGSLTHMIRAVGTQSQLLLWLLSVGGVTAHSMPERSWFVGYLVVVVADLQIQSWDLMRQSLIRLAFHDRFCDLSFRALWNEVEQRQKAFNVLPSEV